MAELPSINKQLILVKRPEGSEKLALGEHFELVETEIPELNDGQILVKVNYLSCDPTQRIWSTDAPQYMPPVQIGAVMRSGAVGEVIASNSNAYSVGDTVSGLLGWQEYAIISDFTGSLLAKIPEGTPIDVSMGPIGLTGITAYFGLVYVTNPKPGDKVLVSGAAGATGSMVVQIAKIMGCTVYGIAGGPEKCAYVKELGATDCVDYKNENVAERLRELGGVDGLTGGFDIYFDNVGGEILNEALANIAMNARVSICGAISQYKKKPEDLYGPPNYINLLMRRGTMKGFIVTDFAKDFGIGVNRIATWVGQGKIKAKTDVQEGPLENIPEVYDRIFTGQNNGKQIMKIIN
eukprot:TRINITY_DN16509_c0_g1_i1.p1 TRINITY_DN16509_c0_g1~~TRINITY_DN16509_c0_g1_i1.p1  ORF type:complete len:350 (+),score=152.44 TRINITY_DN16509_c0_g1_i1:91-1140(+)